MQYAFLVAKVKNCRSPNFVTSMSKNPFNGCHCLWRLIVSYKGKVSLFNLCSLYSCCAWSPLLKAIIRIRVHRQSRCIARFVELLNIDSPVLLLSHRRRNSSDYRPLVFISNCSAQLRFPVRT